MTTPEPTASARRSSSGGSSHARSGGEDEATTGGAALPSRLPRTVLALSLVSLLTDVSSEMIYPLLPTFLATAFGASALSVGAIEGVAETVASLLKYASGWWSDRVQRRKPLVVAGYLMASALRPLTGLAQGVGHVLAIRVGDRIGKGLRTAPRDALLADSVAPSMRGAAFGFHRAADHAGAVIGPLVAFALMRWLGVPLRGIFLLAAIPAALAMVVLVGMVREDRSGVAAGAGARGALREGTAARPETERNDEGRREMMMVGGASGGSVVVGGGPRPSLGDTAPVPARASSTTPLQRRFGAYLAVLLLFTLGNSTDAFLLLRAQSLGVEPAMLPVLWAAMHAVKALASAPAGALSDRVGRRQLIIAGWLVYAATYLGFAYADAAATAWLLFLLYGTYFALTEGVERALVADLVPAGARGRAFGWYNLTISLGALPASLGFGAVWNAWGASAAFTMGAALAASAAALLPLTIPRRVAA